MKRRSLLALAVAAVCSPAKAVAPAVGYGTPIPYCLGNPRIDPGIRKLYWNGQLVWASDVTKPNGDWAWPSARSVE